MDAEDASILSSRQSDLVRQARFYGFDIASGAWSVEQALCPMMPDTIMLHYLNRQPQGTESLFTALVPRDGGRIWIVPIYYQNATPYHPAAKNKRNYRVFNQRVPDGLAAEAVLPHGNWLAYAACYAEMVGGHPRIAMRTEPKDKTLETTAPFVSLSKKFKIQEIRFADRVTDGTTEVWDMRFSPAGRVIGASWSGHEVQPPVTRRIPSTMPVVRSTPEMPKARISHPASPPPF